MRNGHSPLHRSSIRNHPSRASCHAPVERTRPPDATLEKEHERSARRRNPAAPTAPPPSPDAVSGLEVSVTVSSQNTSTIVPFPDLSGQDVVTILPPDSRLPTPDSP